MKHVNSYNQDAPTPEVDTHWRWGRDERTRPLGFAEDVILPAEEVTVREVKWNGEEWWVRTDGPRYGLKWNDLSVFWENAKPV